MLQLRLEWLAVLSGSPLIHGPNASCGRRGGPERGLLYQRCRHGEVADSKDRHPLALIRRQRPRTGTQSLGPSHISDHPGSLEP